ncbi:MAG: phosphate signaling complex protein PhoU [Oligoflexia bacterium]|nr:phosphate signaling complex protein PhoU [Oligoflexia bacterium]
MERHFDASLRELKEQLLGMAGYVERAIDNAVHGLQGRNPAKIRSVYEIERTVNREQVTVDESCVRLLALQQPMAVDLRLIVAIIKINTDLERMGDQAVNIANNSERYLALEPLKPLVDLPLMFDEVKGMVRDAINSFVRRDEALAREVLRRDDAVDELKRRIFTDVLAAMKGDPGRIDAGICLILIARNLERIGDHATNIAEDVVFAVSGEDIRHARREAP